MIDWANIKRVTKPLFARLCGIPLAQVQWKDEPEASSWTNTPTLILALKDTGEIGIDEERRSDNAPNDETVTVCGQRRFTLQVECESFSGPIDDPNNAAAVIARLKTRLSRTSTVEELHGIYGIETWEKTRKIEYVSDDRNVSKYVMDLHCLTVDNDDDTTAGAGGYINEVLIDGTLKNGTQTIDVLMDVKGS